MSFSTTSLCQSHIVLSHISFSTTHILRYNTPNGLGTGASGPTWPQWTSRSASATASGEYMQLVEPGLGVGSGFRVAQIDILELLSDQGCAAAAAAAAGGGNASTAMPTSSAPVNAPTHTPTPSPTTSVDTTSSARTRPSAGDDAGIAIGAIVAVVVVAVVVMFVVHSHR
jgi:hypothetical protein